MTIPKETASGTATFTLTPTQDAIAEGDESIDVTGTATDGLTVTKAEMTLTDDDTAAASITLTVSPTSVAEDDDATTVTVTATLDGSATRPGATAVTVSVSGGTATSGTDYAAVSNFTVTIPKETASGTATFTLTPTQDAIAEGDESIDVTGTATDGLTVTKAEMTLTDDDTAAASRRPLTVSPTSVAEDDDATTVTVTATLDGSATRPGATAVTVSVSGGTATSGTDYAAVSNFTVTIPKETASGTATFTLTPTQDAIAEGDESIDVTGTATDGLTVTKAEMTLTDDDTAAASITLTVSPTSVAEDDDATTVTVTATLDGSATRPGATAVTVSVSGGTATSGTDYAAVSNFTVTIPKETASGTATFTLTPTQDAIAEGDESIDVTGTATDGLTVTKAEMTLTDDDTAGLTVSPTSVSVSEGDPGGSYTVVLDSQPTADVTVTITVTGDDVSLNGTMLTFTSADWDTPQTVTVTATDDTIDEDTETVTLTHTTSGGGYGTHRADVTVSIGDNDDPAVRVSFEKDDHPTEEGAAGVGVALVLSAEPQADTTVEIRVLPESTASRSDYLVSTRPVVDAGASDYVQLPADGRFSVTFKAGKTLTDFGIKPLSDMLVEGDEQIVLAFDTLPAGVTEGSPDEATVTIADAPNDDNDNDDDDDDDNDDDNDNDDPNDDDPNDDDPNDDVCQRGVEGEAMFEVSVGPRDMIAEGDNSRGIGGERATVTVSTVGGATCSQDRTITLDLAGTAVRGHDYSVVPGTLTLPAGKTSVTATVTALDDGDDIEPTETIDITLRHEDEQIGAANVRISPCDNAGRGWAFSWLTIEGLRRAHRRPGNVTSPFTLRVCFSEPVSEMVINDYPYNANATLIIASHEVRPADEACHYVTGTLSNLREIQQDQIWLVDVTADYTGHFAVTLLGGRRFRALDGRRDNNHHHAYSWLWVTVPGASPAPGASDSSDCPSG